MPSASGSIILTSFEYIESHSFLSDMGAESLFVVIEWRKMV